MTFRFDCTACGQVHEGMPSFAAEAPLNYYSVPAAERDLRCRLETDSCVIDGKDYYIRGCIELPVHGEAEPFTWGVWVSLSSTSFNAWLECFDHTNRSHVRPLFGWLNAWLKPYPDTMNIKTRVHLRDNGIRPFIELEPTDHLLAIEQRDGITVERVAELYAALAHDSDA